MPLPSSGGIAQMEILNIMEGYNLQEMGHNSSSTCIFSPKPCVAVIATGTFTLVIPTLLQGSPKNG